MKRLSDIPLEIAERLDLPAESVAGVPKLTVTGRRRALVENHCGLLEYSHECIVVDGGRVRVCIRGTNLQLVAMDSTALLISGTIACENGSKPGRERAKAAVEDGPCAPSAVSVAASAM